MAEIWMGSDLLAEIGTSDDRQLTIEICPRVDGTPWRINVDRLVRAIELGKQKLSQPSPFRVD